MINWVQFIIIFTHYTILSALPSRIPLSRNEGSWSESPSLHNLKLTENEIFLLQNNCLPGFFRFQRINCSIYFSRKTFCSLVSSGSSVNENSCSILVVPFPRLAFLPKKVSGGFLFPAKVFILINWRCSKPSRRARHADGAQTAGATSTALSPHARQVLKQDFFRSPFLAAATWHVTMILFLFFTFFNLMRNDESRAKWAVDAGASSDIV